MIQLLFTLLAAEVAFVFVLLFKTPLRKLAIIGLDRLKRGRGPVMVKTVAGTMVLVLASSIYSMTRIRSRSEEGGAGLTPTDQVLMSRHLLEASLMGIWVAAPWGHEFEHYSIYMTRKKWDTARHQAYLSLLLFLVALTRISEETSCGALMLG